MAANIAVLGLGTMGSGMALNLLKAGHSVAVYNRSAKKAETVRAAGARVAATPAEAAHDAQFILSMLADDAASRAVWLGETGALQAVAPDSILLESSTVTPAWIAELGASAAKRNLELLDAPVTGSRVQAQTGQLTFLVGGSEAAFARAAPVLEAMSKEMVHVGPLGSGAKLKLINNFLCAVQIASLAEGLTWLERSGLDRNKALTVLRSGAPGSPLLKAISERMESRAYEVNFVLRLMTKDLEYALREAQTTGVELSTARTARNLFEQAVAAGYGESDMSAVIEPVRNHRT